MTAQELYDGVARAVEAAKPAQEYCLLWINHWSTCMTKAEWSGWVQALGAVGAILWSGHLANKQISASRKAEEARFKRRMSAYAAFFQYAHELTTTAFKHCSTVDDAVGYTEFVHDRRVFDDLKAALAEPKLAEMESGDGVYALLYMRRAMEDVERLVNRVSIVDKNRDFPLHEDDDYIAERDRAERHLEQAMARFKSAQRLVT